LRLDLESDFASPHDLSSLARRVGVSIAYLCRIFKTYTGKTVMAYLLQRRIQAAIWKLREEGDEKIISIALGCGFNDLAYFNRVFKRVTKMTPSQYRRRLRKGALSRGARQIGASGG
jgi:AraC-like DNA-binding protein